MTNGHETEYVSFTIQLAEGTGKTWDLWKVRWIGTNGLIYESSEGWSPINQPVTIVSTPFGQAEIWAYSQNATPLSGVSMGKYTLANPVLQGSKFEIDATGQVKLLNAQPQPTVQPTTTTAPAQPSAPLSKQWGIFALIVALIGLGRRGK